MPNTFTTTGGLSHSTLRTGLTNGSAYTSYVRCQDAAGNADTTDYSLTFSVAQPANATPLLLSNAASTEHTSARTTQATLGLASVVLAPCKRTSAPNPCYRVFRTTFTTTGGLSHSTLRTGLTNGSAYTSYVRCQDVAGNADTTDYSLTFSVAQPGSASLLQFSLARSEERRVGNATSARLTLDPEET